ncbi:hypothetical protein B5V03_06035 [Bradyrhizobium betae]|uniref:Uncharacterized protein n=1 Tax=Bradyrhizobium betae TaxID=244734 RepID=A0A4Q1VFJ7_9BRAD|nr:hypothetical protein B5V03_06035 [Bradyrhizobium betae]
MRLHRGRGDRSDGSYRSPSYTIGPRVTGNLPIAVQAAKHSGQAQTAPGTGISEPLAGVDLKLAEAFAATSKK